MIVTTGDIQEACREATENIELLLQRLEAFHATGRELPEELVERMEEISDTIEKLKAAARAAGLPVPPTLRVVDP